MCTNSSSRSILHSALAYVNAPPADGSPMLQLLVYMVSVKLLEPDVTMTTKNHEYLV